MLKALVQPFEGHQQKAIDWMRAAINPCDSLGLQITGVPDKEITPAYTLKSVNNYAYSGQTFKDFTMQTSGAQYDIKRMSYTATFFYVIPNALNAILVIEQGEYAIVPHGTSSNAGKIHFVGKWLFDPKVNGATFLSDPGKMGKYAYPGVNKISMSRMLAQGITITNNTAALTANGQFYCTYFNIDSDFINPQTGENVGRTFLGNAPISVSQFMASDVTSAMSLDARSGVYGVSYNPHPEYKYQRMTLNTLCEKYDETVGTKGYFTNGVYLTPEPSTVIQSIYGGASVDHLDLTNRIVVTTTSGTTTYAYPDALLCQPEFMSNAGKALGTYFYETDDWTWKGMALCYTGDIEATTFAIKVATGCNFLVSPSSSLTPLQPPPKYDPDIIQFVTEFLNSRVQFYPSSFNAWNKVWNLIKQFYRSNKGWVNDAAKAAVGTALKAHGLTYMK